MSLVDHYYWRGTPTLPSSIFECLKTGVRKAVEEDAKRLDELLFLYLKGQGIDVRLEERILPGRRFKDDLRIIQGQDHISVEIEKEANRLEFDLLKMMAYAETIPSDGRAFGCLIIPDNLEMGNPFIAGNGKELRWDYVTKRLLPMISGIEGLRISNILVLGYTSPQRPQGRMGSASSTHGKNGAGRTGIKRNAQEPQKGPQPGPDSLAGRVIRLHEREPFRQGDVDRTIEGAIQEDERLLREGRNPAKRFREERERNNREYMRRWILGCHFDWLNPR
jgi:hypothetical protein